MIKYTYKNKLHPGQQEIWDNFILDDSIVRAVVVTGRQTGKTTLAKRSALHWVANAPGCEIGFITPESKHYLKVFNWIVHSLADIVRKADSQKNVIYFDNGSTIYFYSVENYDAIRGATFTHRIMDEFGYGRFGQQEAINAYDATFVAKGIKDLILSTPKGKNQLYDAFQFAEKNSNEYTYRMKTEDNPMVSKAYLAKRKLELPEQMYLQEYEGVFLESGGEVFAGIDKVCIQGEYAPSDSTLCFGVDWGAKNDKSVLFILNDRYETVHVEHSYSSSYVEIIDTFSKVINAFGCKTGYAETNGVGQAAFDLLKAKAHVSKEWIMSQKSKQRAVSLLRNKIQTKEILLPTRQKLPELYQELSDYQVKLSSNGSYSYTHAPGKHDDYLDALMLAVCAVEDRHAGQINPFSYKPKTTHRRLTTF